MASFAVKLKRGIFLRLLEASALGGFCLLVLAGSYCRGSPQGALIGAGEQFNKSQSRYIGIDEVRPGMDAYCLTDYKDAKIEKFGLEVLSVVRGIRPGQDAILVQGTDQRFIHTGPVWGCSGSPVYIDGRLAGALAFAWIFSKDPLYGVTPIEDILKIGQETQNSELKTQNYGMGLVPQTQKSAFSSRKAGPLGPPGFVFDFSKPLDFAEIDKRIQSIARHPGPGARETKHVGAIALPCPLITYGLPTEVREQLGALIEPFGLVAVGGVGGGNSSGSRKAVPHLVTRDSSLESRDTGNQSRDLRLAPGACLAVPLVTGDIKIEAIGAVTEVFGDKVYGFGHGLLGYGQIDLPIATAQVHAVVSNLYRSFRLASSVEIVGALTMDESAGVLGRLDRKARMIPLTIRVARYNDAEKRVYNCQIASNRLLTPLVLRSVVAGAALLRGNLPPENTIAYKGVIDVAGFGPISFENVSSGYDLAEVIADSVGPVAMLMNNPYEVAEIRSLDFDISIMSKSAVAHIWSVDLSDSKVKAGQTIEITVVVESVLGGRKKYESSLRIPDELVPGQYDLIISGGRGYGEFLKEAVPYRFVPQSLPGLIEAMNNVLSVKRDKLYRLLVLPAGGIAVEKAELPDLPATKALILQDGKRTLSTRPYSHWLEQTVETGTVVIDKKVMRITVEE
jgi:hypothetical protein